MDEFVSGQDDAIYALSECLGSLDRLLVGVVLSDDCDAELRDRIEAVQAKAALLKASGHDLEDTPF